MNKLICLHVFAFLFLCELFAKEGLIIGDNVNLRVKATTSSGILAKLPFRSKVQILKAGEWFKINSNLGVGFVRKDYVYDLSNEKSSDIHVVICAISDYSDKLNNQGVSDLALCDLTAIELYRFYKSNLSEHVPEGNISILLNEDATIKNILETFRYLDKTQLLNNKLVFHFLGHGSANGILFYDGEMNDKILVQNLQKLHLYNRKLIIKDACYSGSIISKASPIKNGLLSSDNITYLTSSSPDEKSLVVDGAIRGNLFSSFLLKGLYGEADSNQDYIVTLGELYSYVKESVSRYSKNLFNHTMSPLIWGLIDTEMPVSRIQ